MLSLVKREATAWRADHQGFTLIEVMIVVAIIGLLAMIALPSFANARTQSHRTLCVNNLTQISRAKDQYAFDHNNIRPRAMTDLVPVYVLRTPQCPLRGTYQLRGLGRDPRCTQAVQGHTI